MSLPDEEKVLLGEWIGSCIGWVAVYLLARRLGAPRWAAYLGTTINAQCSTPYEVRAKQRAILAKVIKAEAKTVKRTVKVPVA